MIHMRKALGASDGVARYSWAVAMSHASRCQASTSILLHLQRKLSSPETFKDGRLCQHESISYVFVSVTFRQARRSRATYILVLAIVCSVHMRSRASGLEQELFATSSAKFET